LLESGNIIDAYCLACDLVWPVNAQERNLVATAIAAGCAPQICLRSRGSQ
jgi:hypothetical protein